MRPLKPNSRGAFVPTPMALRPRRKESPFSKPCQALGHLDRVIKGEPPRICIVRSRGGIGDVLMTTPTVKAISKKYNCKVDYATDFEYLDGALLKVMTGNPYVGHIFEHRELDFRKDDYNAIINLTCPCTSHEKPLAPPVNRIDLFARHATIPLEDTSMDFVLSSDELEWARNYISSQGLSSYKLIMVQPSSSNTRRDAPVATMKNALTEILAHHKDIRALIITHSSDNTRTEWKFAETHVLQNFDVRQLAALMHYCDLVLCPDSAILHVASAFHKPTVTLFGPTDPRARVNYHPEAVAIWPGKELHNYPCWYEDPKDGYLCWKRLEPNVIAAACLAVMNKTDLPPSRDLVTFGQYKTSNEFYEIL